MVYVFLSLIFLLECKGFGNDFALGQKLSDFVTVKLDGQLGNQLFQVATAYAYSLDNHSSLIVPDLLSKSDQGIPHNAKKIFLSKILACQLPSEASLKWKEPSFRYSEIPYSNKIYLEGYFQSEKYFKHRRKEVVELFKIADGLKEKIFSKYSFLNSNLLVVGIQIRDYRNECPTGDYHPTHGKEYYQKAVSYFPEDAIFLVSSNNKEFAKECVEGLRRNIVYLNELDYIEEFYTLTLCKSFIISNSSFGWWASWLSDYADKKVIAPIPWFSPPLNDTIMRKDLLPPDYVSIENLQWCINGK